MPTENISVSVVMPCYREAGNIADVLRKVRSALSSAADTFEIVVIDDGSPDGTWQELDKCVGEVPELRAFRLSRNFGKELALTAGLDVARGAIVIVMDGDGQHPPELIPEMLRVFEAGGVDMVEATKVDRGKESAFSRISANLFYWLWNKLSGFEMRGASDFKLLSRRAVDAYLAMDERAVFFRGMTAWLGFERAQVPFEVGERKAGSSSWSVLRRVRLAVDGISGFSSLPLQLVTFAGLVFLAFSIIFAIYTIVLQITGRSVSGFATVILLLLVIGSLLMISLGIIGIYLARIYDEIKHRPRYVIARSIDRTIDEKDA
jgi:glycosyltransferase involved in cell wall biosynthesis